MAIRWNSRMPALSRELASLPEEVNRLFDGFLGSDFQRGDGASIFTPAVDIEESADDFTVRMDLPGVSQKDVKVNLMGDTLTIRGERKPDAVRGNRSAHRIERVYGTFERSFTFGAPVKNDGIKAQYRDGVLEVVVPKAEEAKVREIEIQVAS
ncbi:MAG: Hsp20/alpha crystallin family protein [Candidatus Eisenbacteria bacterium]|uniref:Hsp20/alpha crystallin family protein n=1 Tax=Eiseniibacteriota bacterium TaxID=2212470 RepID=A0A538U2E8_UNCEI|nr:MAG: Hsp20/alpha crystallin family protein [Candidatus Eisenbacteria bacterium]